MKAIPIHLFELYLAASLKLKQRYVDGKKDRQQAWQIPYAPPIYMYMACYTILGPKIEHFLFFIPVI